jgi:very-short-patch-repair endonuclease
MSLNESIVEDAALEWFGELGYSCLGAEALTPALSLRGFAAQGERESYSEVVLVGRLREAIRRLNPAIPEEAREEALRKVLRVGTPSLTQTNRAFHRMLRDGIPVECVQQEPSPQPSPSGRGSVQYRGGFDFSGLKKRARELREKDTKAEEFLWELLRNRQLDHAKFRRNHQFGDYICDFYCHESKLVVECDGDAHNTPERRELDRKRDVYLRSQGLTVLRFENSRVLKATDSVLEEITSHLPSTSGRGAGGEGLRRWQIVRLIDFDDPAANDWLVVNQFTVIEGQHNRRPDIVVFVNGLPLGLIELKNAADEDATIWSAYAQLQTYKAQIPTLLHYNAALVVSDGLQARMGSVTANQEWFKVWREPDGSPPPSPQPSPSGRGSEHYRGGFAFAGLTDKARELRRNQTPAEDVLWELLRDRQLMGAKFRRQHQFGEYICDFFCHDAKLVVECDGEPHSEAARMKHDAKRDAYLRSQGLTVVRFANDRVLNDTAAVLQEIGSHLPSPSGRRAGDEGQQRFKATLELQTLIYGVFERERFLKLLLHFIVFEEDPDSGALHKIIAGYHQFHAVNAAVEETVRASGMTETGSVLREEAGTYWSGRQRGGKPGDRRAGVVWSRRRTRTRGRSSAITFPFTTSSAPSPTRPRCRSITRAGFPS